MIQSARDQGPETLLLGATSNCPCRHDASPSCIVVGTFAGSACFDWSFLRHQQSHGSQAGRTADSNRLLITSRKWDSMRLLKFPKAYWCSTESHDWSFWGGCPQLWVSELICFSLSSCHACFDLTFFQPTVHLSYLLPLRQLLCMWQPSMVTWRLCVCFSTARRTSARPPSTAKRLWIWRRGNFYLKSCDYWRRHREKPHFFDSKTRSWNWCW